MDTKEVLNKLISEPLMPFTVYGLKAEMAMEVSVATDTKMCVLKFIYNHFQNLVRTLNIPMLSNIMQAIKTRSMEKLAIEELKLSADPTLEEVRDFLTVVHQEAHKLQTQKDEITHFISFFSSAKIYVTSFASAAEIILQEVIFDKKELKDTKAAISNDLETYKVFFTNMVKELNRISDEILSPKSNLCMRMDSAVRLLGSYRNPINNFNVQG